MGGGWGASHNGVKIGCFWDGIEYSADGSQARITNAHIKIDRAVNIADSSNNLSWSGGLITDGSDANVNLDGSGSKTIKNCTESWVTLSYTGTVNNQFDATLSGCNYAGQTLYADESQTFPQRAYALPVAPTNVGYTGSLGNFTVSWTNNSSTAAPWEMLDLYRIDYNTGIQTGPIAIANPATATSIVQTVPATSRYYWYMVAWNSTGNIRSSNSAVTPTPLHTLTMSDSTPLIDQLVTFTIANNGSTYKSALYIDGILVQSPTTATSINYTFAQATWASRMSSVTAKTVAVILETWTADGASVIGSNSYTLTVSLPSPLGAYAPSANVPTVAEQTANIATAFGAGTYIQNISVVRVTHSGAAGLGATITKKEVIVNGSIYDVTVAGYKDIPVVWTASPTAQSRTTDTRGQVATSSTTVVKGYSYAKPVIINFTTQRVDGSGNPTGSGTQIKFTVDVSATSIINGTEQNKMGFNVYLAVNGVKSGGALYTKAANSTLVTVPASVSGVIGVGDPTNTYSKSLSYSFILEVTDDLASSTVTRLSSIPTEIIPLSIGPNGIAVGKVYDDVTQAVDVLGDVKITGDLTVTGALSMTVTDNNLPSRLGTLAKSVTDWNTALTNGWYMASGAANAPVAATWFIGEVIAHNSLWITQELYAFSSNSSADTKTYRRQSIDSGGSISWGAWYRIRKSEAELDARYAALSHTHDDRYYTETEVNNLLAAKRSATDYRAKMTRSSAVSLTANTWAKVSSWATVYSENFAGLDTANGHFNIDVTGNYDILFQTRWEDFGTAYSRAACIVKGAGPPATDASNVLGITVFTHADWLITQTLALDTPLLDTDYVTFWLRSAATTSINEVNTAIPGWTTAGIVLRT